MTEQEMYDQVALYTLEHARTDPSFIHQYAVDAYAAQHAAEATKTIRTAFALIGLYLHVEKNYSGKRVQRAHMQLAKKRKRWPAFKPPAHVGDITVADVPARQARHRPGPDDKDVVRVRLGSMAGQPPAGERPGAD